jgi:hypothetical protein
VKHINIIKNTVTISADGKPSFTKDWFKNLKYNVMKSKILFPLIFFAGLLFVSLSVYPFNGRTTDNKTVIQQVVKYTCPAHPEVVQDVPGSCPKCGMALVEKKEMSTVDMPRAKDSVIMNQDDMKMKQDTSAVKPDKMKM